MTRAQYYEHLRQTNGFARLGSKGGKRSAELAGKEGMAARGRIGGAAVKAKFKTKAEQRAYYAAIGSKSPGTGKRHKEAHNDSPIQNPVS
jgi:hypothetical protein